MNNYRLVTKHSTQEQDAKHALHIGKNHKECKDCLTTVMMCLAYPDFSCTLSAWKGVTALKLRIHSVQRKECTELLFIEGTVCSDRQAINSISCNDATKMFSSVCLRFEVHFTEVFTRTEIQQGHLKLQPLIFSPEWMVLAMLSLATRTNYSDHLSVTHPCILIHFKTFLSLSYQLYWCGIIPITDIQICWLCSHSYWCFEA